MVEGSVCEKQVCDAAFQGSHGAFSEDAAFRMLPADSEMMPCPRLEDVFSAVDNGRARYGVIPVENTLAGSVHRSYDLMFEYDVTIVGETICRIDHCLIGLTGSRLENIQRVISHPQALAQCEDFFRSHPSIEPVSTYDTAGALHMLTKNGDCNTAAIASRRTAEMWSGVILAQSVQDHPENYTRFLLISKPMEMVRPQFLEYKRTLVFRVINEPGALCRALQPFATRGVDVAKIESRPVNGSPFEYMFYLDLIGRTDYDQMFAAVEELRDHALSVRVLGMYSRW